MTISSIFVVFLNYGVDEDRTSISIRAFDNKPAAETFKEEETIRVSKMQETGKEVDKLIDEWEKKNIPKKGGAWGDELKMALQKCLERIPREARLLREEHSILA